MGKLHDRVAVVTGAASGIGYGIAVAFEGSVILQKRARVSTSGEGQSDGPT